MTDPHIEQKERLMHQFIKIGERVLSLNQIQTVDLKFVTQQGDDCVAVCLTGGLALFYDEEAEIIKRFLTAGSRTYDLDNLYGDRNS